MAESKNSDDSDILVGQRYDRNEVHEEAYDLVSQSHEINGVKEQDSSKLISHGHTIKDPELLIATPIDLLFLILPCLHSRLQKSAKGLFLPTDDLLESACEGSKYLQHIVESEIIQKRIEARMAVVCDMVDAGDEKMYRLNIEKLVAELIAKAKRMILKGLPASMETKFVAKTLEIPVMSLKREESSVSQSNAENCPTIDPQSTSNTESQSSAATSESTTTDASEQTDITIPDAPLQSPIPENVHHLLRLRTVLHFILTSYLPPALVTSVNITLSSPSVSINFTPLDTYLNHVANLRAQAQASRSLSDFSRKRNMVEDEEVSEVKAEKRRKKEEDEKRQKASETKAIRDLKKVDVKGMKKMSDFFGKPSAAKKR